MTVVAWLLIDLVAEIVLFLLLLPILILSGAATMWTPLSSGYPEKGKSIEWITPSGEVVRGEFFGGAVWIPEGSNCYGYYTPTYWRYV